MSSDKATMTSRRVVLFGLFGIGNLGNESTLWVTLHHLRRRLPNAQIVCVCDKVPAFAGEFGVTHLPFDPMPVRGTWHFRTKALRYIYLAIATLVTEPTRRRRAVSLLASADQLVVVGTGALDDLGELPWGMPAWILRWCRAARRKRTPVHLLSVGAGPIRNAINRFLMTRAVASSQIRSYRDNYSREYMAKLGVTSPTDQVVPDLVFAMPREWQPAWRPASNPPKVIGVGVMAYFGWNVGGEIGREIHSQYIGKMAVFVRRLLDAGYGVRLLIGERGTDARAAQGLFEAVGPVAENRLVVSQMESASDVLREIMLTDLVVASRFHNLILALALARPVVSVGYSAKFEALMEEMELSAYCQSIESLDVNRLYEQVSDLAENHEDAVATIVAKTSQYRERLEQLYDSTFGVVPEHQA